MKLKMKLEFHLILREQKYRIEIYWYRIVSHFIIERVVKENWELNIANYESYFSVVLISLIIMT